MGWTYHSEDLEDDGFVKTIHYAVKPDGRSVRLDFTPYREMPEDVFSAFVELGFPDRSAVGSCGPLTREDLDGLRLQRV